MTNLMNEDALVMLLSQQLSQFNYHQAKMHNSVRDIDKAVSSFFRLQFIIENSTCVTN